MDFSRRSRVARLDGCKINMGMMSLFDGCFRYPIVNNLNIEMVDLFVTLEWYKFWLFY